MATASESDPRFIDFAESLVASGMTIDQLAEQLTRGGIGIALSLYGAGPTRKWLQGMLDTIEKLDDAPAVPSKPERGH